MTPNDNRHTRKASGGNQRQIGVKIEGLRHLDLVLAKVMVQLDPCSECLPSKKTSAKRKLRNAIKFTCKRPASRHASQVELESSPAEVLRKHCKLALRSPSFKIIDHQEQANRQFGKRGCSDAGRVRGGHPLHSPAGADARFGAAGSFLRESATTTARENKSVGWAHFSRKLRCHNSNISNRQMRPV